mgnify:CR=1 FL=1
MFSTQNRLCLCLKRLGRILSKIFKTPKHILTQIFEVVAFSKGGVKGEGIGECLVSELPLTPLRWGSLKHQNETSRSSHFVASAHTLCLRKKGNHL